MKGKKFTIGCRILNTPCTNSRPTIQSTDTTAIELDAPQDAVDVEDFPEGGIRAWLVVTGASLTLFPSFGFLTAIGTLQDYWARHQLRFYSSRDIGWISGLLLYLWLAAGLIVGPCFDRYGPRWVMLLGSVGFIAMFILLAHSSQYWHFMLSCSIIGGLSGAMLSTSALGTVALWFKDRRGFAQGIAMAGSSLGGLLIPIILRYAFPQYGYAWSMRILAFMAMFCLALGNILLRKRSAPARTTESARPSSRPAISQQSIISFSILSDLRVSLFAASVIGLELVLFLTQVLLPTYATAQTAYPTDIGFYLLAVCNGASVLGRLGPGYISDKLGQFNTLLAMILFMQIFTVALWLPFGHTSLGSLYAFSALFGFGTGSWMALIPACVGQLCPPGEFGRYYGVIYFLGSFVTLVSVPIGGQLLEGVSGQAMIGFCCAVLILSMVLFALSRWACLGRKWVLWEKV
ncbi:major facilitator superfamily domain-containing protein [Microdochium trichocladiopsis]|uniref:Major facilitator superfamily domain-containing protein n=1 Tax=Microdochium trichocladiopsis TaxID=1682393 RepID=A0A9P8YDC8_9PEZI|nr:major facilitator superfamily domain-containing protein [Microdochium trichocladiopsis]KAH7035840.1 major facilitator superfamily domain-containing protein [Microdochium trichocladiopsis]